MEVFADVLTFCNSLDNLLAHITRVAGHIMNTLNAGNNIHTAQQLSESVLVAKILAVGIYVLAQQSKFLVAIFNRCLNLGNNIIDAAAALASAYIRHDAVGAEIIAAIHNWNPGSKRALAYHMTFKLALMNSQIGINRSLALCQKFQQQTFKIVNISSTQQQIYLRMLFTQLFAVLLCHTACNTDNYIRIGTLYSL